MMFRRLRITASMALLAVAGTTPQAEAQVTRSYAALPSTLGELPRCVAPGQAQTVLFPLPDDVLIQSVTLAVTMSVPDVRFLRLRLASGSNQATLTLGVPPPPGPGPATALAGAYTFTDGGPADFWQTVVAAPSVVLPGAYRVTDAAGVPVSIDGTFGGLRSAGRNSALWTLALLEDCGAAGPPAAITAAALTITGLPVPAAIGIGLEQHARTIPDSPGGPQQPGPPAEVQFIVPAGRGTVQSVAVSFEPGHTWAGEVVAQLMAPDGASHVLFGYTGAPDGSAGSGARLNGFNTGGGYVFTDQASTSWWAAATATSAGQGIPTGSYRTSQIGGPGSTGAPTLMDPAFAGRQSEGVWTLRLTDGGGQGTGMVASALLTVVTSIPPNVPAVTADAFATPFETALSVSAPGVLVNDTSNASGILSAVLDAQPTSGTVALAPSGAFTYTPLPGFVGADAFTYRAVNLVGSSSPVAVSVDVAPPVTIPPGSVVARSYDADVAQLGLIPRSTLQTGGEGSGTVCLGGGLNVPIQVSDDLLLRTVTVTVTASVSRLGLLAMSLRPPGGPWIDVVALRASNVPGANAAFVGTFSFSDTAAGDLWTAAGANPTALPPGAYRGSDYQGGVSVLSDVDHPTAGPWLLRLAEYCHTGPQGSVQQASLFLTGLRTASVTGAASSLGAIPDGPGGPQQPGAARDVTFVVPPGRGEVRSVNVSATFAHERLGDLVATLIAPDGAPHVLFGYTGARDGSYGAFGAVSGTFTFSDQAARLWWNNAFPVPGASFRTSELGGPGTTGVPTVMNPVFAGRPSAGVWTLRFTDGASGSLGRVTGAALALITSSAPNPPTAIDDVFATLIDQALVVPAPGVLANDANPAGGVLEATLVSPAASGSVALAASGAFTYAPNPGFVGTDSFTYQPTDGPWAGAAATVAVAVTTPTSVQAPTALRTFALDGHRVILRWTPPALGPVPDGYVIEAGLVPGQVLGSIVTGPLPVLSLTAPLGIFYVRVRAAAGGATSASSNEIRLVVETPAPPSTPEGLTGVVVGDVVRLTWQNTFSGGVPTGLVLVATGSASATTTLPLTETVTAGGVPAGNYTITVRATNAAGASPVSAPLTLTVPEVCTGAPPTPVQFLAYGLGNVLHLMWEMPPVGAAVTSYVVQVGGAFTGAVPVTGRAISGPVPPGSYTLSVAAVNACGSSALTASQTVTIP